MKRRRLYVLSALALVVACQDQRVPTAPSGRNAPAGPSAMISDGAHCSSSILCNPDFFFLPPMVSNPVNSTNYEAGTFNGALQPSLSVEICQLSGSPVDASGLPVVPGPVCVATVKQFPLGTVRLQGGTPDGSYQVLWHTQESNLDVNKFYRIKVMIDGSSTPLGVADIDPVSNMKEFKNARTGEVIPLNDDSTLPINFRIEKNGSPCLNNSFCTEQTVTNAGATVRVLGNDGPLAGALFPPGWIPPGGPASVLVSISRVNTGSTNPDGTQEIQCHRNLRLQQFDACFKFTTYPKLGPNSTNFPGHQFQQIVTTAVCYVLYNNEDARSEWVQLWASDDGANFRKLPEASDLLILSPDNRNCSTVLIGDNSTGFRGLASAGWRKLKGGLGQIFGVQTAYGVDLGLGGSTLDFSNISPTLTTQIDSVGLVPGESSTFTAYAKITGIAHDDAGSAGINGLPVTFTVAAGNGDFGSDEGGPITQVIVPTSPFCGEGCENGIASVNWNVPNTPGPHTITATGPACLKPPVPSDSCLIGPITFTVVVPPPIP